MQTSSQSSPVYYYSQVERNGRCAWFEALVTKHLGWDSQEQKMHTFRQMLEELVRRGVIIHDPPPTEVKALPPSPSPAEKSQPTQDLPKSTSPATETVSNAVPSRPKTPLKKVRQSRRTEPGGNKTSVDPLLRTGTNILSAMKDVQISSPPNSCPLSKDETLDDILNDWKQNEFLTWNSIVALAEKYVKRLSSQAYIETELKKDPSMTAWDWRATSCEFRRQKHEFKGLIEQVRELYNKTEHHLKLQGTANEAWLEQDLISPEYRDYFAKKKEFLVELSRQLQQFLSKMRPQLEQLEK